MGGHAKYCVPLITLEKRSSHSKEEEKLRGQTTREEEDEKAKCSHDFLDRVHVYVLIGGRCCV